MSFRFAVVRISIALSNGYYQDIIIIVIIIIIIIVIIIIIKLYYTMQQLLQNANHYQGNFDKVLYDRDIFHQFSSVLHGIC